MYFWISTKIKHNQLKFSLLIKTKNIHFLIKFSKTSFHKRKAHFLTVLSNQNCPWRRDLHHPTQRPLRTWRGVWRSNETLHCIYSASYPTRHGFLFFQLYWDITDKIIIYVECTTWFATCTQCQGIPTIKVMNTSIAPQPYKMNSHLIKFKRKSHMWAGGSHTEKYK